MDGCRLKDVCAAAEDEKGRMSKVRINDLARELEVKSNAILDALKEVGVTEKKTHSSSLEQDEAARVRALLRRSGGGGATAAKTETKAEPKIDWSRVSKPGDAAKAILERKQAESGGKTGAKSVAAKSAVKPVEEKPVEKAVEVAAKAEPEKPTARKIVPQQRQQPNIVVAAPAATPAIASKPPAAPVIAKSAAAVAATPKDTKPAGKESAEKATVVAAKPAAKPAPETQAEPAATVEIVAEAPKAAKPAAPARRMVMPQTGPRPTYIAQPTAETTAPGGAGAGVQRGRPIFERPRPGAPGSAAGAPGSRPSAAGGRRPMHPTRTGATGPGARPGFGGPGGGSGRPGFGGRPGAGGPGGSMLPPPGSAPAPGRAQRPGQRRGGQRYEKTKEGPMKGFMPPPRFGGTQVPSEPLPITRSITVTEGISVKDLAEKLDVRAKDLIATLLMKGVFVTVNQSLDGELVKDVARQFGADTEVITVEEQLENEALTTLLEGDTSNLVEVARPPVVTVMGHVDHGKTSLLDAIRETEVAAGEAGGITQHIGAYKVKISNPASPAFGREIVFLDTPGHEAFTRMRARGAKVTDIVVVVVAADDGVMPQTLEAIDHAKAANVPIIVAVNKIDKPEANPDRVKKQLGDRGLVPEDWGGSTVFVDVSAKKRIHLDLLEEMICLVADLGTLRATPDRPAVGTVIESKLDRGRGAVATVLVQNGTLRNGDSFVVGNTFGKVRAMFDDHGRAIDVAGPSTPVEILGLESIPDAGDTFLVMVDRDKAKGIAQYRKMKEREAQLAKSARVSLEGLSEQIKLAGVKDLNLILKGDVQGSIEVLASSLQNQSTEKVHVKVLHSGVGAITESDVLLASASNAIIIGFNVRPERKAQEVADRDNVDIRLHSIIYELEDEINKAMHGLLEPVFKENYSGRAEVVDVFKITKVGTIAGCRVTDGTIKRDMQLRLMRGGEEVYKGKLSSLKRFKDDVSEVRTGVECGIGIAGYSDFRAGDVIEAFVTEKMVAELGATLTSTKEKERVAAEKEKAAEKAAAAAAEKDKAAEPTVSA
jgi:translation initiation factor IF-2